MLHSTTDDMPVCFSLQDPGQPHASARINALVDGKVPVL